MRGFAEQNADGEWDMLVEARPLDIDHRVDTETVSSLFQEIVENPPELPKEVPPYEMVAEEDSVASDYEIVDDTE